MPRARRRGAGTPRARRPAHTTDGVGMPRSSVGTRVVTVSGDSIPVEQSDASWGACFLCRYRDALGVLPASRTFGCLCATGRKALLELEFFCCAGA